MSIKARTGLSASMMALVIGLAAHGVARAQGDAPASLVGVVTGMVAGLLCQRRRAAGGPGGRRS